MDGKQEMEHSYLRAVLSWLDALLERDVRLWQLAGQNPDDRFRGLYIANDEALAISQRKAGEHWGVGIELPEKEAALLGKAIEKAQKEIQEIEAEAKENNQTLRLLALKETFELTDFEWWALIVTMAPALDLRYEKIYGYLQDDVTKKSASVDLILNLLAPEKGLSRLDHLKYFDTLSPLRRFKLIMQIETEEKQHSSLRQAYTCSPSIIHWVLDAYHPSATLGEGAEYFPAALEDLDFTASIFNQDGIPTPEILESLRPFISMYGNDTLQQEYTARQMAAALGKPILKIILDENDGAEIILNKLYASVRDARMLNAWLYIQDSDIIIDQDTFIHGPSFDALRGMAEIVLFSSKVPFKFNPLHAHRDYPLMHIPFKDLSATERADLWISLFEEFEEALPEKDILTLAGQFTLTSAQIIAASSTAISIALQEGRALNVSDLFKAAQFHSGNHLPELAQKIEPRYAWEDIVLPETPINMLRELVLMVKSRPVVLEQWGLGKKLAASNGISALFAGPPGTGKTLAAQIIANELGIDLYRIDLSTVVSKYVGETEKNLEKIFSEASESNAILFFDEADTIFGKRSEVKDAQDRYANLEVGYLLQRMESYNGLAILATNLKANLDDAFTRRLQFIINFPFPDEEYRHKIWQVLIPPTLPREENLDLELLAKRFKLAGGNIRNIILSAAYYAAENGNKVTMPHLLHGARREIQKMGKLVQESDFTL
ncbi:AAA family ATPase [bacterium]|nr:AAA family ATPase [bacterium]